MNCLLVTLLSGRKKVLGRIKAGLIIHVWVLLLFVAVFGVVLKVGKRYIKPFKKRKWKAARFVVKRQPLNKVRFISLLVSEFTDVDECQKNIAIYSE